MLRSKLVLISAVILSTFVALPALACHHGTPHGQDTNCGDSTEYTVVPFDVSLNVVNVPGQAEEVIVTDGDLSVSVVCQKSDTITSLKIFFMSLSNNWFVSWIAGPQSAGSTNPVGVSSGNDNSNFWTTNVTETAVSASGNLFVSLSPVGVGINMFGSDCVAKGIITTIP